MEKSIKQLSINKNCKICRSYKMDSYGIIKQIKEFFGDIFSTQNWPARWRCGSWSDFHGWLYIISDVSIGICYFLIPLFLFSILKKRKDIPFPTIVWLFISFIVLCGSTHIIDAVIFWWPVYRLSALLRLCTGVVSIFTVISLFRYSPMIYKLRTADQLEEQIEERKQAEQKLREQELLKKAAEELVIKKDEFMNIASHELRTPLTSLKANLQILDRVVEKNETEKIHQFVERANKQVDKLTHLIKDLLDVTTLQSQKLLLSSTKFDICKSTADCIEEYKLISTTKITLKCKGSIIVFADKDRVDQVICNLLENAIKYSPNKKPIKVNIHKDDDMVYISITDQGIGISSEKISQIFTRFYRAENTSQNFSGLGLGLYISHELISQLGGDISVNSILGIGSTFTIKLPYIK